MNTPIDSPTIAERISKIRHRLSQACAKAGRSPDQVQLLAVSKTKPESAVRAAYEAGLRQFGENYVQEGVAKVAALSDLSDIVWHYIGPLQSNKTRLVAEHFHWYQALERSKIARRLAKQRPPELPPLQVLIQINIDDEATKAGIQLGDLPQLAATVAAEEQLQLRGLMAIPAAGASPEQQQQSFQRLQAALLELQQDYPGADTLSLGMSQDLEAAIQAGSTMVRIGTDIFGPREY